MQARLKIDASEASDGLEAMIHRAQHMGPVMAGIAEGVMRTSVVRNFEVGGRFDRAGSIRGGTNKWDPVADNPTPLIRSGTLRDSLHATSTDDTATLAASMEYAAIHNFGGQITIGARSELFVRNRDAITKKFTKGTTKGRGHTIGEHTVTIPARPFVVLQEADIDEASDLIRDHILGRG